MKERTIAQHVAQTVGLRNGMRVVSMFTGWVMFVLLEEREPNRTELAETLGWDRSKLYRHLDLFEECFPGVEFDEFARWALDQSHERLDGRAPTPSRLGSWPVPSFA